MQAAGPVVGLRPGGRLVRLTTQPITGVAQTFQLTAAPGQLVAWWGVGSRPKRPSSLVCCASTQPPSAVGCLLRTGQDSGRCAPPICAPSIALVPQQSSVFSGTLQRRIRFGRPPASEPGAQAASLAMPLTASKPAGGYAAGSRSGAAIFPAVNCNVAMPRAVLGNPAVLHAR